MDSPYHLMSKLLEILQLKVCQIGVFTDAPPWARSSVARPWLRADQDTPSDTGKSTNCYGHGSLIRQMHRKSWLVAAMRIQIQMQDADAVQCWWLYSNVDAKVKHVLMFVALNSTGEMRAMHAMQMIMSWRTHHRIVRVIGPRRGCQTGWRVSSGKLGLPNQRRYRGQQK